MIGSGPNGLTAAIILAKAGFAVTVHEANPQIGGGARSAELTLPGFIHDVCSAVHPMAFSSPCFEQFPLSSYGLEWVYPEAALAHPLDDGSAILLVKSIAETAAGLGSDGPAWCDLMQPLVDMWQRLRHDILAPPLRVPRHPLLTSRFGLSAIRSARALAENRFRGTRARALFAGIAAHSVAPLEQPLTAAYGLVLGLLGHVNGWPIARGGSQKISDALAGYLVSLRGEIRTGSRVLRLDDAPITMCDVSPRQLLVLGGDRFPARFRRSLERFRPAAGAFKLDWALDGPIPWKAAECARAGTVHLGGTMEEIARWESRYQGSPFVLLVQQSMFDQTRAPAGKHTAWAYCHVPNGSTWDMADAIELQVERFAPGFRERILSRHVLTPAAMERNNPNLVGGDFSGGALTLRQFLLRPSPLLYSTPLAGVYICSASTPPGGAVHGMCGFHAANRALRDL